eukprot:8435745-Alexandrium_andersonii.AAC.1
MTTTAAEMIFMGEVLKFVGLDMRRRLWTDSTAARAMSQREGPGKLKQVILKRVWLQSQVEGDVVEVRKVHIDENYAD